MALIFGGDYSQFQGTINYQSVVTNSDFCVIRASYGTAAQDTKFAVNQAGFRAATTAYNTNFCLGYYYFAYPTLVDPITSANFFISNLGTINVGEFLALDLEGTIGSTPVAWSLSFLQQCEFLTNGTKPLIYLNQSILTGYDWTSVVNNGNQLWIARYDGLQTTAGPHGVWPEAIMKQWTDTGTMPGISGNVDQDTFWGVAADLRALGYQQPTPPPPPPTPKPSEAVRAVSNVSIGLPQPQNGWETTVVVEQTQPPVGGVSG